jgi:HD-GYP domain-containing protein (c-di-GMP phosphodiesterase class II)
VPFSRCLEARERKRPFSPHREKRRPQLRLFFQAKRVICKALESDSSLVPAKDVKPTESDLLCHHSTRVYYFGALAGLRKKLKFDPELLYIGAMFHDIGLTKQYRCATERFEVDSANAARVDAGT